MPTSSPPSIRLPDFIDERPISPFQYAVLALCGTVMFLNGFDTQAISYVPRIAAEWDLTNEMLGPIFSSSLVGFMVGYLALSPLSDRLGHRRVLIASTLVFCLTTLVAAWSARRRAPRTLPRAQDQTRPAIPERLAPRA